jgi:minor extracellular serine protease Vpr
MRRRALPALAISVLLVGSLVPSTAAASGASRFGRIDVGKIDPQVMPALIDPSRQVDVMVEMSDQPVAGMVGDARDAGSTVSTSQKDARRGEIQTHQKPVEDAVRQSGGVVVGSLQDAYAGVHVHVRSAELATLAAVPGVVAIHLVPTYRPALTHSVPYIGAPEAWTSTGETGAGVKIAVIDTGVDFYHADFGGSGNPADYTYGLAHDTTVPALNANMTVAFPSAKIPVGYDFVGDAYDAAATAGTPATIPQPDPNPLDCDSHGTHTASTAAGVGVLSNGKTYTGPYNSSIYSTNDFRIGPGVAPKATLFIYKVFGCSGSTDVVVEAINRAVKDGADVISMSLGSDFGTSDTPDAVAADNAARAGVVVVASTGNEGPSGYMTGTPGSASRAISVAGVDSNATFPGATIHGAGRDISAIDANNGPLPVTGTLHVLTAADGSISLGCDASEYAGVAGQIVVTLRGTCDRVARAKFGQAAGAKAVIMVNNGAGLPPFEGPISGVTIPFIGTQDTDGAALLAANSATVTIDTPGALPNPTYKQIADFSSWGPRYGDSALKPEITAPAVSVVAAGMGTGNDVLVDSGTSMSAPHVAGVAALVIGVHPSWSVNEVKAAIMSTADATSATIVGYDPRGAGSGVVQAQRATATAAVALTRDGLDTLSFDYRALDSSFRATKSFTIKNESNRAITYKVGAAFVGDAAGASVVVSPSRVTVSPHQSGDVSVTLSMSASAVAALPPADTFAGVGPGGLITVEGLVTATPTASGSGVFPLHVPFLFVPRGTSDVTVGSPSPYQLGHGLAKTSVALRNRGIHDGTADVYAWGLSARDTVPGIASIRAVGVQSQPGSFCDPSISDKDRCLIFAINGWHQWSNASAAEFDIAIDTNGDGAPEFVVVSLDLGLVETGSFNGIDASFTFDAAGNLKDAFLADAPLNGSVIELPALASDLGLKSSSAAFSYSITGFDGITGNVDAVAGQALYNAFSPSVSNAQFVPLAAGASAKLPLSVDSRLQARAPSLGWMVVSLDNPNGAPQAALIPVGKLPSGH